MTGRLDGGGLESHEGILLLWLAGAEEPVSMGAVGARLVLLVDHSKFGQRALSRVLDISQIDDVVTDDRTPDSCLTELRDQNVSVHVATVRQTKIGDEAYAS